MNHDVTGGLTNGLNMQDVQFTVTKISVFKK